MEYNAAHGAARSPRMLAMKRFHYAVLLAPAEEGGYVVTCRDLPPLITQGEDEQDALAQAADAMDEVFAAYRIEGIELPEPSSPLRGERLVTGLTLA